MTYPEGAFSVWPYVPEPGDVVRVMPKLPRHRGLTPYTSHLAGQTFCVGKTGETRLPHADVAYWRAQGIPAVRSTCGRLHHFCIVQPLEPDEEATWRLSNG